MREKKREREGRNKIGRSLLNALACTSRARQISSFNTSRGSLHNTMRHLHAIRPRSLVRARAPANGGVIEWKTDNGGEAALDVTSRCNDEMQPR